MHLTVQNGSCPHTAMIDVSRFSIITFYTLCRYTNIVLTQSLRALESCQLPSIRYEAFVSNAVPIVVKSRSNRKHYRGIIIPTR